MRIDLLAIDAFENVQKKKSTKAWRTNVKRVGKPEFYVTKGKQVKCHCGKTEAQFFDANSLR